MNKNKTVTNALVKGVFQLIKKLLSSVGRILSCVNPVNIITADLPPESVTHFKSSLPSQLLGIQGGALHGVIGQLTGSGQEGSRF